MVSKRLRGEILLSMFRPIIWNTTITVTCEADAHCKAEDKTTNKQQQCQQGSKALGIFQIGLVLKLITN